MSLRDDLRELGVSGSEGLSLAEEAGTSEATTEGLFKVMLAGLVGIAGLVGDNGLDGRG